MIGFRPVARRLVLLLFLISGAVGLGYQVLWSRYLLEYIGVSAYSYATVLAAFMGGLALGSALLGRLADRIRSPLRLFALLEAGVGAYALVYPHLSAGASVLYSGFVSFTPERAGADHALWAKVLVAGLLLLVPTTLMGGTYPALVRHATERLTDVGRTASQLYAVNALGAVAGALLMAFALMPAVGMRLSLVVLALANGLVAAGALLLARGGERPAETSSASDGLEVSDPEPTLTRLAVRMALGLILVEGFLAFALEIAWTRYFGVVLGSSTYSFALVLAAFLSGIALGSAWLSRSEAALRRPLRFFGWTQVLAGLSVLIPLGLYPHLPWLIVNLGTLFSNQSAAFFVYEGFQLLVCYLVMLPPATLIGMALPLLVKGLARDLARLGGDTGRVYAWNTWGNVAGALVAGLVLLPALGMEHLLRGAALASAALGLVAIGLFSPRGRATWLRLGAAAAVVLATQLTAGPWQTEGFALEPARRVARPMSLEEARARMATHHMVLFEDDPAGLLMVYATGWQSDDETLTLSLNGKPEASSHQDLPTQILVGHVPLLLAPQPREVLVIGLASGVTAGSALTHPVRRLDVVDIVAAMPEATREFNEWNRDPLADPRLNLIVDDARSYLSHTRERYDVIISEPSNPWMAGTGALFSREFYARAAAALEPDGLFLQWLQAYELSDETFAVVVRTFRRTFSHVYAFQGNEDDLLLLGTRRPLEPDWDELERRLGVPAVRDDLERLRITSIASLLAFQMLSPTSVDYIAAQTLLENTDDNLLLEYRAPRDLFSRAGVSLVSRLDERLHGGPALLLGELLRRRPGSVPPRTLLSVLSDRRIQYDAVHEALQLASYELDPTADERVPLFPPPDAATFAARVAALVGSGREEDANRLAESRSAGLLLLSALAPERARFWERASLKWLDSPLPEPSPRLRRLRIELLMAMGRRDDATREILAWMEETPGPEPRWLALRACEIDRGALCDAALDDAAARSPAPFLDRLIALRAEDSQSVAH
jgi:predicted membrane-bound spermidine synthase